MKKPFVILAAALCTVCAVSASGCGNKVQNLPVMYSNWYAGTNFKGFQPTICEGNTPYSAEKITYTVAHEPLSAGANSYYSVSYGAGTYTTEFYAAKFNAENFSFPEDYKNGYAEAKNITAYCYKTTLSIDSVTYTLKSDPSNPKTFEDEKTETVCWFLSVKDRIRPLYSKREIKNVIPNSMQPKVLEEGKAYKTYNMEYEVFYNYEGTAAKTVITDNTKTENNKTEKITEKLNKATNAVFDFNSLDVAVRASNLYAGASLSQAVSLFIPSSKSPINNFTLAGLTTALGLSDEATNALKQKLGAKGLYVESEAGLQTVAVSVNYSGKDSGGSQTYWFTSVTSKENNVGRATLLKYTTPVSYYLGNITYTLDNIESTFWNG